jgi:hypothetical protein
LSDAGQTAMNNPNDDSRRIVSSLDGRRIEEEGEVRPYRKAIPFSFRPFQLLKLFKLAAAILILFFIPFAAADETIPYPDWWDKIKVEIKPIKDGDNVSYSETRKDLLTRSLGFIRTWHLIGSFPEEKQGGFKAKFPPETKVDLQGRYPGKDGKEVAWKQVTSESDRVDLRPYGQDSFVYAYTEIQRSEASRTRAWFSSRDGLAVWINGAKQFEQERRLGDDADQYSAPVDLVKGTNRILLKICNTGSHSYFWFNFRISDYPEPGNR